MHCTNCGSSLEPGARFCGACGTMNEQVQAEEVPTGTGPLTGPQLRAHDDPHSHAQAHSHAGDAPTWGTAATMASNPEMTAPTANVHPSQGVAYHATPSTHSMIGRDIIGQYTIQGKIGEGGMGEVYLADQTSIGRKAAIKVMHPAVLGGADAAERFGNEARAAASLTSPHIVSIYNYGAMEDGTLFMAMEYLEGVTLSQRIRNGGALDPWVAVDIANQICGALSEAHAAGIVHRDLKPSNIMLVQRGEQRDYVKVLDFGIAKVEGSNITREGGMLGTPQYMSPEQLKGEVHIDGRSDIYSLAVMVYEMLVGVPPFTSSSAIGFINKHLNEAPSPLRALDRGQHLTPQLETVVLRALAKDPGARPQTADEFRQHLQAALHGQAVPGAMGPSGAYAQPAVPVPAVAVPAPEERKTGRIVVAAILGTVLVLGAAAAGFLWWAAKRREERKQQAKVESKKEVDEAPEAPADPPAEEAAGTTGAAAPPSGGGTTTGGREAQPAPKPAPEPAPEPPPEPAGEERPPVELSPETAALADKSIADLEKEFDRVLGEANVPPSTLKQIREAYQLQKKMTPAGAAGDQQLKGYLVQIIKGWDQPHSKKKPGYEKSVAELKKIFMEMELENDMAASIRQQVLDTAMQGYDDMQVPDEDKDYYRRIGLAEMIRSMAKDKKLLDPPSAGG